MSATSCETSTFDNICRICMENSENLVSVFSKCENVFIAQIINECAGVEVTKNDGLPEHICVECSAILRQFWSFALKIRNSDHALRGTFKAENVTSLHFATVLTDETPVEIKKEEDNSNCDLTNNTSDEDSEEGSGNDLQANNSEESTDDSHKSKKKQVPTENSSPENELEVASFTIINVGREKFLCCVCFNQSKSESELLKHCKSVHARNQETTSGKKFFCQFCNRRYSSNIAAKSHRRKIESIKLVYECKQCGLRVHEQQRARKHSKTHSKPKRAQPTLEELKEKYGRLCCAFGCSESFETDDQLNTHARSMHSNRVEAKLTYNELKPIECPICFKQFKDDEGLQRHSRFKYKATNNICTQCGAKFPSLASLTIHERSHTKEKPFKCEICSKGFGDKQSLKRHYVKHTNEKPFTCSICGVSFKRKRAMQSHMIIHEPGKLPFKCEMCEKRFRVKAKLLYHMRTHTGERPYSCRYCDKAFADFSNRMRHEMSHTGEKPYKCSYCPTSFITKRLMLVHEKGHKKNKNS